MSEINPEELMRRMDALLVEIEKRNDMDGEDQRILNTLKNTLNNAKADVAEDVARVKQQIDDVSEYVARKYTQVDAHVDAMKSGLGGAIKGFKDSYKKAKLAKPAPAPAPEPEAPAEE